MNDEIKKKGLGRGLMSLFGDQVEQAPVKLDPNSPYFLISISDLVPNPFQPRNFFDEKKIEELSQSIKKMD